VTTIATDPTVDPDEVRKFAVLAKEWWNPRGKFAPLHKFNPTRLKFIRDEAARHFARDLKGLKPFEGLSLLDIGCGGGLLSEPMARMGFAVTGADASEDNIQIARAHAAQSGVKIDYRFTTSEALAAAGAMFDMVLNMEVIEHVADPELYLRSCAALVKPGGVMFVATLNKTLKALALAKVAAEYILGWLPPGTHDWDKFVEPHKLRAMLEDAGLNILKTQGVSFDPLRWDWQLSGDADVNYMVVAGR
ncbi:MAG TPA: bifunctional 2-polyprenyl-6-hydroxyphenol methylase/3-demethylubiquinol 3-O-methyltransferase UbiG, partial [Rhizomicrobium sp.]|nr:bifunctional 2-polyprenyl-6-hydroxyphenol methylase/3-demethylubiquinol 3-O-methyltransferase UbiG [Rhizomicrobium sp.]